MKYIDQVTLHNKRILVRVDYNVSLNPNHTIANDERIAQSIPTLEFLLNGHNKLILVSHLGRPKGNDPTLSLSIVAKDLQRYFPDHTIRLIDSFQNEQGVFENQDEKTILLLENIRFFEGEKNNDISLTQSLAKLADAYVNDAFSASHRNSATIVGIPKLLPSFGGLLMKKEVTMLSKLMDNPQKPFVAILGGNKISTKINLINKLTTLADTVLLGGGIANTFIAAEGVAIGQSLYEKEALSTARTLTRSAKKQNTKLTFPSDVVILNTPLSVNNANGVVKSIYSLNREDAIYDIGPETQKTFTSSIQQAKTIIWNGPVGYFEDDRFRQGTDAIYNAIAKNSTALSIVGGGNTLAAIAKKEYLSKITHISTGGGAMLEFIENGTLPGITALDNASTTI